jgi:predicted outer membrane repeat protein
MYAVKNPSRNMRLGNFSLTPSVAIKLLLVCLVTVSVPYALYVRVDSKASQASVTVQAAGRGKQFFNFKDGRQLQVGYRGDQNLTAALQSGQAQPRALGSIVLAANAVPDLIAGYAYGGMGIVTVQHGNPDAFAPTDESVYARMQQGYNPDSLLPLVDSYSVPESPDFLQVGDFNHDNRKDVLIASRGGSMFLLAGDGHGALKAAERISLPGRVTALTAGEFRALDGWTDVAIGVETPSGPALLIYDGVDALSGEPMSFQLSAPATALQISGLDNDSYTDVAVAAGNEVDIVHGWGRKQEVDLQSRLERISVNNNARDLAVGFFIWNRAGSSQIAVLSDNGAVNILDQAASDARPFTAEETAQFRTARLKVNREAVDVEAGLGWQQREAASWASAREFSTNSSLAANPFSQNVMQRSHVSFHETDDLLILNGSQSKLDIVRQLDGKSAGQTQALSTTGDLTTTSLDVTEAPAAVLALPQKLNGERNLVLLQNGSTAPVIVPLAPTATPVVDRFDDPVGGSLAAASVCGGGAADCSLRGAVQVANANPGSTITIPAGTVILTSNGGGAGGCEGNTIGDLGINTSTTINGAGSGSTIILQNGSSPATNQDRIMCLNEPFSLNVIYSFSGMTISGGRDNTSFGAAAIVAGEKGNALTLTNVVISNNQSTGANVGGGAIQILGGDLTLNSCTIGGSAAPGAFGARSNSAADLAKGNTNSTSSGAGIGFDPSAPTHDASTGVFTSTNTTFGRNVAGNNGGGITLFTASFNGHTAGTGSANFGTSTFSNNSATNGGGIENESFNATVATTAFNSNTATQHGGGIHVGGGTGFVLDGTSPSITFTGNTATLGGGSVSTNGLLNVSGTNTTIGGSVEVQTNGTWTNNAGSALNPTDINVLGGTFTCNNSTMNVSGNLTIGHETTKGAIFNANTGTVNIQGNLSVDLNNGGSGAIGQFNAGTGTFNFNGSAAQSITNVPSTITFNNLTDSNVTQPLTLNNNVAVSGTLNINGANAILAPVAAAVISGGGTLTGSGTARVTRTGADSFFSQYTITTKTLTNLTVEYIGAAAQTASTTTYGNLKITNASGVTLNAGNTIVNGTLTLQTGPLAVSAGNSLTINNGTTVVGGSITSVPTGTVNYNQGSAGQNVRAFNYGNLTFSAFTKVLASTGTIGVSGTFNPNGVTSGHTITGSTIDFNGTGAQTVPVFSFNNLTISGARGGATVTLAAGTIGVAGTFNPSATAVVYSIAGNTFDFNGSGAQSIAPFNYNNLTISGNRGGSAVTLGAGTIGIAGVFNPSVTNNTFVTTGNTVNFNGSALQTIPAFTFGGLTITNLAGVDLAGAVTVNGALLLASGPLGVNTNTLTLNGAASFGVGTLTSAATGTVNYNQQSNGQATVLAANYGNLTFSNFSKTLASTGTIGIAGTFTPGTGTGHTITGSTINFNGAGAQTIPGFTYNNLTSTGAVARTLDPVNTIKIAGTFTPGASTYTITGSTVEYNGTVAQVLPNTFTTYNNLTLNNVAGTTGFAGLTVQGLIRVQAGTFTSSSTYNNVQIDSGATLAGTNATTINVSGNWTNNGGTFTPNGNIVNFNGAAGQTIGGTSASQTFNDVIVNKTGTLDVGASTTSLTLHNLTLTTGTFSAGTATTINVNGNWTNNGGTFTPGTGTVNFNGAAVAQSIGGTATTQTFQGFTVNKSGAPVLSVVASTNTLDINGNVTLTLGNFTAGTATAITVAGNWTNNGGSFTGGSGTVTFDGGAGQTIGGTTATTFNNLTNGNASGLAMSFNETVNGALALTSGDITVAATRTLTQPFTATSSGTFDVNGRVQRTGFITNGAALSFGNPFNTILVTSGTALDIVVDLTRTVPVGFSTAVQRFYTITPNPTGISATLRLHYLDSELNGNVEGPNFIFRRFTTGIGWQPVLPTSSDFAANWLEAVGVTQFSPWTFNSTFAPTASNGVVSGRITDNSGNPVAGAVVRLSGTQNRKFITDADGFYRFENVEANGFYTVTPTRANYTFSPAERNFTQNSQSTDAAFSAAVTSTGLVNPLDTPEYFVRQQYLDFLGREPDEAGFNYWSDQILACGADTACSDFKRQHVSAAYFYSIEFQETGGTVDSLNRVSFGAAPQYSAFLPDTKAIGAGLVVGKDGWQATLEANKQAFVADFVNRQAFHAAYDGMSNGDYVDALISHTGVAFTSDERDALVNGLTQNTMTRAGVLRSIAENNRFVSAKLNETFVMMEYFGYLRRQPDAAGFTFWLDKLNQYNGNFEQAEMVKAFIVSGEYRDRFPR